MNRLSIILCSLALAGVSLFAVGAERHVDDLDQFALDPDFTRIGDYLVGTPDFTGNPRYAVHEIRAEKIGGPGDRDKSHWRAFEDALPERPISEKDYAHQGKTKEHPQGIAKGHLNDAADNSQSQEATDSTFNTGNCFPEDQACNAQSYERSEKRGRDLALLAKRLKISYRIVAIEVVLYCPVKKHTHDDGVTWDVELTAQGDNQLWRPTHVAKIYYVEWGGRLWTECYLFENAARVAHDDINDHVEAIDEVEWRCNRDIFRNVKAVREGMESSRALPPSLEELAGK